MATSTGNYSSSNSSNIESPSLPQVAAVSVKPPSFWIDKLGMWFAHVEAQFPTAKITVEKQRVLNAVSDIVTSPPENTPYQILKATLISCLTDSDNAQFKKIVEWNKSR
ncbi:hypothetical protein NPIL_469091 [Nephila pilipes]|uniref:DUF7041 domain-containing protein n=1 Tax=Nephila pilipes TaxID=299642 RepID=A0A8X6QAH5_NEPPI|nr:hypothetical protein NPIL_469091 [Nephila pilipes]